MVVNVTTRSGSYWEDVEDPRLRGSYIYVGSGEEEKDRRAASLPGLDGLSQHWSQVVFRRTYLPPAALLID